MTTDEQKKLIEQYCAGEITGNQFTDAVHSSTSVRNGAKPIVKCWCFLCHIELMEEKDKLEMHGETVCQQCWDDNMYMALQDGGGC